MIYMVLSSVAQSHMREFTLGHLSESWSASGGRQLVGMMQTWPLSLPVGCYRLNIHPSPLVLLLNHQVDTHLLSLRGWKAELT